MKGILIDTETGDLLVHNGKLVIGDNAHQCAEFVLRANRGDFKEHPLIGAEITRMVNGTSNALWCANTKAMLKAVGLNVRKVKIDGNNILVE